MRLEELERVRRGSRKLDLELHRIGLEVDEAAGRGVLGPRLGAAVQVDDQLRRRVQPRELALAHPVAARPSACRAWYAQRSPEPERGAASAG